MELGCTGAYSDVAARLEFRHDVLSGYNKPRGRFGVEILWLYKWPIWIDGILFLLLLLIAVEVGFRTGLRRRRKSVDAKSLVRGDVTLGSMLALLGLLLAFTYAYALSRADMRKQAIVHEANAIGTAFLRANLGSEPGRSELRQRLLDYARTRLVKEDLYGEAQRKAIDRSLEAQSRLWPAAERALKGELPGPIQGAIMQSVNEVLDTHAIRLAVINDRIPGAVLALLLLVAVASLAVAAQNAALNGAINRWRMSAFSFILAALMLMIVDFDRGQSGLIRINLQPLEAVVKDLEVQMGNGGRL